MSANWMGSEHTSQDESCSGSGTCRPSSTPSALRQPPGRAQFVSWRSRQPGGITTTRATLLLLLGVLLWVSPTTSAWPWTLSTSESTPVSLGHQAGTTLELHKELETLRSSGNTGEGVVLAPELGSSPRNFTLPSRDSQREGGVPRPRRYLKQTWHRGHTRMKLVKRRVHHRSRHNSAAASKAKLAKPGLQLWGGAAPVPTARFPGFYTPRNRVSGSGPCWKGRNPIKILVRTYSDILQRVKFPWWRVVTLEFQNDVSIPKPLVLGWNFTCSIFIPRPGLQPTIRAQWSQEPGISFYYTSNILFRGINFKYGISKKSKICEAPIFFFGKEVQSLTCPGIYVVASYGIQITMAEIYGRIDIFRSLFVRLDHLKVTTATDAYNKKAPYDSWATFGVIRMGETNVPGSFRSSNNVISNCEVYGHWELITIFRGAVGVTVRNNYLHDFEFVAIRCGAFSSFVFDCHHNYIGYNRVWNKPEWAKTYTAKDNSGIYMALHWNNPANYITCNYIENQRQCLYFDEVSSGITVEGGMCHYSYTAVKVNGGKFNRVTSLVVVKNFKHLTHITCRYVRKERFPQDEHPRKWEGLRRKYWDTPAINKAYPFLRTVCNPVPTKINGQQCNPPGGLTAAQTGKCSGLPYTNYVESFAYYPSPKLTVYVDCEDAPSVEKINQQVWFNATAPVYEQSFKNAKAMNFGLRWWSPIWKIRPNFRSCPSTAAGPQRAYPWTYNWDFNIPRPAHMTAVIDFDMALIIDGSVQATS